MDASNDSDVACMTRGPVNRRSSQNVVANFQAIACLALNLAWFVSLGRPEGAAGRYVAAGSVTQ